ncbi:MAG: tRNA dihydrouridine(20/20a) synthase DusA [Gammaproteobacteria bacterium]|nr:tRNA dihydrouridine(20/20a) synthase DusA [Gammaproteobacteria bacterium]
MIDCTDKHARYFMRLMTQHALLYTEMITVPALMHGDTEKLLAYNGAENPLALQLGGSDPVGLAQCARLAEARGYDEVNLNVGCPSERVQSGAFGACLMAVPSLVAECVAAMKEAVNIPVTVKHRMGIDDADSYEELCQFVDVVAGSGCETFIVHARKAWLSGLSPKQNREIPPLQYADVYQLKKDFPHLSIIINGGIKLLSETVEHLQHVDGVMLGREPYHNPYMLSQVDEILFNEASNALKPHDILKSYLPYMEDQLAQGVRLHQMTRHVMGLFHGMPNARLWRRKLSEEVRNRQTDISLVKEAADLVPCMPSLRRL